MKTKYYAVAMFLLFILAYNKTTSIKPFSHTGCGCCVSHSGIRSKAVLKWQVQVHDSYLLFNDGFSTAEMSYFNDETLIKGFCEHNAEEDILT
jgi:hypothetical protein